MRLCLACREYGEKRVNGNCPNCGSAVRLYKNYFIPEEEAFPGVILLNKFVFFVRQRYDLPQFSIAKKSASYFAELQAAISILELCEWDLNKAVKVVERALTHPKTAWKHYISLVVLSKNTDLSFLHADVERELTNAKIAADKNKQAIEELNKREDVFK